MARASSNGINRKPGLASAAVGGDVADRLHKTEIRRDRERRRLRCLFRSVKHLAHSYAVVKKGGIILSLVGGLNQEEVKKHHIRAVGIWVKPNAKDLSQIAQLIDAGKIKPVVTKVLPLSDAIAAERQAETHHTRGKVVLRIADEPKA